MSSAKKLIDLLKEDIKKGGHKLEPSYLKLIEIFPLQAIASKSQHEMALKVIEKLMNFKSDESPEDRGIDMYFKTLVDLVADFERREFKSPSASGAEMLAYLMDLQGLQQTDLAQELGGQSVVSRILNGERELNLRQIKLLAKRFKVSPEVFI